MTTLTRYRGAERAYPVYKDALGIKRRDVVRLFWDGETWMTQRITYVWGGHAFGWCAERINTPYPAIAWNR